MITLFLLASAILSITGGQTSPVGSSTFLPAFHPIHRAVEDSIDPSQCSCPNTRSILGLVWSCLTTIFLCTWVAIHPNIPPTGEMGFITFLRRLKMLFVATLAPELIVVFAMCQWLAARRESIKYTGHGWTMTHGLFLIMGGFVLMKGDEDMGTISCELLEQLDKDGDIKFPTITQEQIQDKSKGDSLSKGIVVLQTFWFIVSCIARYIQGLEVTQLEVVTLAYCSLNAAIYFLWWGKPLDVRTPTPIYLKAGSDYAHEARLRRAEVIVDNDRTLRALQVEDSPQHKSRIFMGLSAFGKMVTKSIYLEFIYIDLTPEGVPKTWAERDPAENIFSTIFRCFKILLELIASGTLFLIVGPILLLMDTTVQQTIHPGERGVHTFYSPSLGDLEYDLATKLLVFFVSTTPITFGALHCLAWKAHFPTSTETLMWRYLSLLITVLPIFVTSAVAIGTELDHWVIGLDRTAKRQRLKYYSTNIIWFIGTIVANAFFACAFISITAYSFARFMLLILSAISLRNLGPTALLDSVTWSNFVPHY